MIFDTDLGDIQDIIHVFDIPSTSAQYRSSGVGILFSANTLANVPIIQPAVAATI